MAYLSIKNIEKKVDEIAISEQTITRRTNKLS